MAGEGLKGGSGVGETECTLQICEISLRSITPAQIFPDQDAHDHHADQQSVEHDQARDFLRHTRRPLSHLCQN